jgi:hypothetical protein
VSRLPDVRKAPEGLGLDGFRSEQIINGERKGWFNSLILLQTAAVKYYQREGSSLPRVCVLEGEICLLKLILSVK